MSDKTFITRVILQNYKSIVSCDAHLEPLTFLVGLNGSGKSNFLDALRFVTDALRSTPYHALSTRGGINGIIPSFSSFKSFGIRLEFTLDDNTTGHYAFSFCSQDPDSYEIKNEECVIKQKDTNSLIAYFKVHDGKVKSNLEFNPVVASDRLYLVNASGLPQFRRVYDALSNMAFYNLNPTRMRSLDQPHIADFLESDGSNIASVFDKICAYKPNLKQRIQDYMSVILPGLHNIGIRNVLKAKLLTFQQKAGDATSVFYNQDLSDGTLRAFGILVALFQIHNSNHLPIKLIGIEEPELVIYPSSLAVILDALREGSCYKQVIVTSHSPDLLDDKELDPKSILAVVMENGMTKIGTIDDVGVSAIKGNLYTGGELLKLNQLLPNVSETNAALFDQGEI